MKDETYFLEKLAEEKSKEMDENKPLVVFLDGRGITSNHGTFNLITGSFQKGLVDAAIGAAGEEECLIYATLDEVSIIFTNPKTMLSNMEYKSNDEVMASVLQEFVFMFWRKFGDYVRFHGYAFSLEKGDEEDYVKWRHERSKHAIYTYVAKEHGVRANYGKMTAAELKSLLQTNFLWESLKENKSFLKGTCVRVNTRSTAHHLD